MLTQIRDEERAQSPLKKRLDEKKLAEELLASQPPKPKPVEVAPKKDAKGAKKDAKKSSSPAKKDAKKDGKKDGKKDKKEAPPPPTIKHEEEEPPLPEYKVLEGDEEIYSRYWYLEGLIEPQVREEIEECVEMLRHINEAV